MPGKMFKFAIAALIAYERGQCLAIKIKIINIFPNCILFCFRILYKEMKDDVSQTETKVSILILE